MPDTQEIELRLFIAWVDTWKVPRTQVTNRANGILTGYGFTIFRLVPTNSITDQNILRAVANRNISSSYGTLGR